jgi:hypothetical protein
MVFRQSAMTTTTPGKRTIAHRVFLLGIAAYAIASLGVLIFVYQVFGMYGVGGLSWILILPFLVAIEICRRWPQVRGREFAYRLVLIIVAFAGSALMIRNWHGQCVDLHHAHDVSFEKLSRIVSENPAYRNIKLARVPFKAFNPIYQIQGTVASQTDLERFPSLCDAYGFSFHPEDIAVTRDDHRESDDMKAAKPLSGEK